MPEGPQADLPPLAATREAEGRPAKPRPGISYGEEETPGGGLRLWLGWKHGTLKVSYCFQQVPMYPKW